MSLKPAQKSQLPDEVDTIYNILPKTIRSAIPGPRYQIASQFPTTKNPLKLFKFASPESNRLSLGTLKTPSSIHKNSKSQSYRDDFDLNLGNTKWAVEDHISGMTSVPDSASSGETSEEPVSIIESFHQRKRAPTINNIKKVENPRTKRQGTPKLKELVRRKSCYCSECGGLSELEKKTVYIPSNHKFPQKIQQKIDEAKNILRSPVLKAINRFNETYNNRRIFSPLASKRKENKSLHKIPSRKGSNYEDSKSTPKAEERRPSAFNKLAEIGGGTPKAGGSEAGWNTSLRKFSEVESSIDFEKKSALSLVRLQSYHTQEAQSATGNKTPGSTNKSSAFSNALDFQEASSRNFGEIVLSHFGKKDKLLRASTHQHQIPRSPPNTNQKKINPNESLPIIYSAADFNNHKVRRDSYLSVKSPNNHSVGNLSPNDLFEIKPVPLETAQPILYNNGQISLPYQQEEEEEEKQEETKEAKRVNKHKIFISQKISSIKPTGKYMSISQRASPGVSPMPFASEANSSAFFNNEPIIHLEGGGRASLGTLRVNTKEIKKKYIKANFSQPSSPGESFRASHVRTLSVSQLEEKLHANLKKQKGNKKTSKTALKIALNHHLPQNEPQKTLLSAKNKTQMSSPGATWRFNSVANTPKLLTHTLEKNPILSGKEKMIFDAYSPKLKERLNLKIKAEKPGTRGKSSHAKYGSNGLIASTR